MHACVSTYIHTYTLCSDHGRLSGGSCQNQQVCGHRGRREAHQVDEGVWRHLDVPVHASSYVCMYKLTSYYTNGIQVELSVNFCCVWPCHRACRDMFSRKCHKCKFFHTEHHVPVFALCTCMYTHICMYLYVQIAYMCQNESFLLT